MNCTSSTPSGFFHHFSLSENLHQHAEHSYDNLPVVCVVGSDGKVANGCIKPYIKDLVAESVLRNFRAPLQAPHASLGKTTGIAQTLRSRVIQRASRPLWIMALVTATLFS